MSRSRLVIALDIAPDLPVSGDASVPDGPLRQADGTWVWSLPAEPASLDVLLLWRARLAARATPRPLLARCGVGLGPIEQLTSVSKPGLLETGLAYGRARQALAALPATASRRYRSYASPFEPVATPVLLTGIDDGTAKPLRAALLRFMDRLMHGWTAPQWQAIGLVLEGRRYEEVGHVLQITPQNVYKRLKAAELDLFLEGHAALKAGWELPPSVPGKH